MNRFGLTAALVSAAIGAPAYAQQFSPESVLADNSFELLALGIDALETAQGADSSGNSCGTTGPCYETALGNLVLESDQAGEFNTGVGNRALALLESGRANTAVGWESLYQDSQGGGNTAVGAQALYTTSGPDNTAVGYEALYSDTTGFGNSALGFQSLLFNATGTYNIAIGYNAMVGNISSATSSYDTALGAFALYSVTSGSYNVASGYYSLHSDTSGAQNTAAGGNALLHNTRGSFNTAVGMTALAGNTTGTTNIGIGYKAGSLLTTGSNNIDIGSQGAAAESGVMRLGSASQTTTYLAGVYSNTSTNNSYLPVVVNSAGQLGVAGTSSERFKTDIATMGSSTEKLAQLRPVKFHYKHDTEGTQYYGLVAEEVAKVYPELVVHGPHGRIDGVRYDELSPMLLNLVQQQSAEIKEQRDEIRMLKEGQLHLQATVKRLESGNAGPPAAQ